MSAWETLGLSRKVNVSPVKRRLAFLAGPVIGRDVVYVGDEDADIAALDKRSLEIVWRTRSKKWEPGDELSNGLLLMTHFEGDVGVLDPKSKALLWRRTTVSDGYVRWRDSVLVQDDDGIQSLDPKTGNVLRTLARTQDSGIGFGVVGNVLLLMTKGAIDPVRAIDLTSGRAIWERNLVADMTAAGAAPKELMPSAGFVAGSIPDRFVGIRGSGICGVALSDGRVLWYADVPVSYSVPLVRSGRIYVLRGNRFIAIDEQSGDVIYDRRYPELDGVIHPKEGVEYAGKIAMPAESGHLMVFDATDGRLVWIRKYAAPLWLAAELSGRLLITARDGNLLVFEDGAVDIDSKPGTKKSTWKPPHQKITYEGGRMIIEDTPEIVYETERRLVKMAAPKVAALSTADEKSLDKQRVLIHGLVKKAYGSKKKLTQTTKDLPLLQGLIDQLWIGTSMIAEQIAMGVALGDVLAKEQGLRWVMVTDEHGRTPALQNNATEGLMFPVTMIAKRYERGEPIKLVPLMREIAKTATEAAAAKGRS